MQFELVNDLLQAYEISMKNHFLSSFGDEIPSLNTNGVRAYYGS